ncbi:MAG TPA: SDR family NAD(P)-dependent oxidoreductase [Candidatus Nanoarchaeia archaeon]|nr:SDR family NAD(P)-dependent oxidoreductase [Candidatus Nanoarchaeia archaeon]
MSEPYYISEKHKQDIKMTLCTIVGMGPGIGYALARRFGREGLEIGMIARNEEHLQHYELSLWEARISSSYAAADAGDTANLQLALQKLGNPQVLIYNAAVVGKSTAEKIDAEKLRSDLQVNVGGALVAVQQVLPSMLDKGGSLLFTGGSFAHVPNPNYFSLSIGKAALWNMAMCLAREYEPRGIHVGIVSVYGKVARGTRYDPDLIAQEFWKLHMQPRDKWEREVHIK